MAARAAISLSRDHTLIDKRASCDMFSNAPFQLEFRLSPVSLFDEGNNKLEGKKNKGFTANVTNDEAKQYHP